MTQTIKNGLIQLLEENIDRIKEFETAQFAMLYRILNEENLEALYSYVSKGFSLNVRGVENETVLHLVEEHVSPNFIDTFIQLGANIHAVNRHGATPLLYLASANRNKPVQQFLIEKGSNPYHEDTKGYNALGYYLKKNSNLPENYTGTFNGRDKYVTELVAEEQYAEALHKALDNISNLGGFPNLLGLINFEDRLYLHMHDLQLALMANNRIPEAANVVRLFLDSCYLINSYSLVNQLSIIPLLIQKDYETAFEYLDFYLKWVDNRHDMHLLKEKERTIMLCVIVARISGNEEHIERYEELLRKAFSYDMYHTSIYELLKTKAKTDKFFLAEKIEQEVEQRSDSYIANIYSILGLYHLSNGENMLSELLFRKILGMTFINKALKTNHCLTANLMIDYLSE